VSARDIGWACSHGNGVACKLSSVRRGVYPGTFDPLTVAHVAIAQAAMSRCRLDELDLALSVTPLAKTRTSAIAARVAAIERARLRGVVVGGQLIADIAEGYDVLVLGADKWAQIIDVAFYGGSVEARDAAVARLPTLCVVPRAGFALPDRAGTIVLEGLGVDDVSSSAVRAGREEWRA
jgi:hypothetical protein